MRGNSSINENTGCVPHFFLWMIKSLQIIAGILIVLFFISCGSGSSSSPDSEYPPDNSQRSDGFNPNANGSVDTISLQPDGKILIGGWFNKISGTARNNIARLNADGSLDATFNPDANGGVYSIAVQADGKILIGGWFNQISGTARNNIARLNADGSLDTTFNPNADSWIRSIAVQADGKILIGGWFTSIGGVARKYIARLNPDGTVDSEFDPKLDYPFSGFVYPIAIQADGKIIVGGDFTSVSGVSRRSIARLNADGTVEASFDPNAGYGLLATIYDIFALILQPDGKIIIGGDFASAGGFIRNNIARLNPDGTVDSALNTGGELDRTFNPPNGFVLYNGTANGRDEGNAVAIQPDGKIVVIGSSSDSNGTNNELLVMRYNVDGTLDTSFNDNGMVTYKRAANTSDIGAAVAIQTDGKIIAVGRSINNGRVALILRYNSDGTPDESFNGSGVVIFNSGSVINEANAVAIQADGKIVIVGRSYINGTDDVLILRYNSDGTLDTSFHGTGIAAYNGPNYASSYDSGKAVAIQPDGKIVVTGHSEDGSSYDYELLVIRYNNDGTLDSSFNGTGAATYGKWLSGNAIAIQPDGRIVVAGDQGHWALYVLRYNVDGTLDMKFNGSGVVDFEITGNDIGYGVAIQPDGKIVTVGRSIFDDSVVMVLRFNSDGTFDWTFGKGGMATYNFGNWDIGAAVAIQSDGKIVVVGENNYYPNDLLIFRLSP